MKAFTNHSHNPNKLNFRDEEGRWYTGEKKDNNWTLSMRNLDKVIELGYALCSSKPTPKKLYQMIVGE
jgi:hypothetical protein